MVRHLSSRIKCVSCREHDINIWQLMLPVKVIFSNPCIVIGENNFFWNKIGENNYKPVPRVKVVDVYRVIRPVSAEGFMSILYITKFSNKVMKEWFHPCNTDLAWLPSTQFYKLYIDTGLSEPSFCRLIADNLHINRHCLFLVGRIPSCHVIF